MAGIDGCNCNSNKNNSVDEPYITPTMWDLYNVKQDTTTSTGAKNIPIFHNTYVGRATHHYPKDTLEYRKYNNYNTVTGKRCKTCDAGCTDGIPDKQFGISQNMAYAQGIVKHPECISGPRSTGRCEMVCNTISQTQQKYNIAKHNLNYIGTSKKMAYGKYVRTTPGMETFASKKVVALQPIVAKNQECWKSYWCRNI